MEEDTTVLKVLSGADHERRSRRLEQPVARHIGPYQLQSRIASGGMGEVYTAQHLYLGRRVAIKILHEHLSADSEVLDRFHAEAQATSRIRHPGIVHVYDYGFDSRGRTFMVTELLEGQTLAERVAAGPLPVPTVIEIGRQAASALAAVHSYGIVHRDIKPENVFLAADTETHSGLRVKVLDFGLSKSLDAAVGRSLTNAGVIIGTPLYMAPEQWRADAIDHRVDVYALGCVLYEMACGVVPFTGRRLADLCDSHCGGAPTPPREINARIPVWLENLILSMIAKPADDRPGSMLDVECALRGPDPADVPRMLAEGSSPGLELSLSRPATRSSRHRSWPTVVAFVLATAAGAASATLLSQLLI